MNCANHPNVSVEHYCRTCGKPLCGACSRDVKGVIYCENCLAARLEGVQPPPAAGGPAAPFVPAAPVYTPAPQGGPNPTVAGILGAIPLGFGAVYNGQYAKGLAHLIIFALLCWGANEAQGGLDVLFGLGIGFFWFYQIFDAVRSARAIQSGQPAPDPFGLAQAFGTGERIEASKVPTAAVVLIAIGILFLLQTLDLLHVGVGILLPSFLIALGGWLFFRGSGFAGRVQDRCYCEHCRTHRLMGPAILVTLGVLGLLHHFRGIGFFSWVGGLLLVIGVIKLVQGGASATGHISPPPVTGPAGTVPSPDPHSQAEKSPADEVRNV